MRLLLLLCAFTSPLLAGDPPVPQGGFPIVSYLDQVVTYADGYRTKADAFLPDPAKVKPPALGWPCVLIVQGSASHRGHMRWPAIDFAKNGYVAIAYDVRGQGDTVALNPGQGMKPGVTAADMAEIFHGANALLGTKMDCARLGVTGGSQGGFHAWNAAAWSENKMPTPRGTITHFPKILAVAPEVHSPKDPAKDQPAAGAHSVWIVYKNTGVKYDPTYRQAVIQAFLKQDFKAIGSFGGQAALNWLWLQVSKVPVFAKNSWNDRHVVVNAMAPTTPRLALVSTGNHGTPDNRLEKEQHDALRLRWFNHFLKGIADELPRWPRFQFSMTPDVLADYQNTASVWESRQSTAFPVTGQTKVATYYLRQGGVLSAQAPAGNETADRISHQVAASFTPQAWLDTDNIPSKVFAGIPHSAVVYRSTALSADRELFGRPKVSLSLDSVAPNLQVHAFLADEDAAGKMRFITGSYRALHTRKAGAEIVDIELDDAIYIFRKGHRLVLVVENHVWHRPPAISSLWTAPYFESCTFDVQHSSTAVSKLTLPLKDPGLSCRAAKISLSQQTGGTVPIRIVGSALRAGNAYFALIGNSGTVPGFPFPPVHVPINFDTLTWIGLLFPNTPPFQAFVGQLNAQGEAAPSLTVPAGMMPASMIGTRLSFTAVSFDTNQVPSVSAHSDVEVSN